VAGVLVLQPFDAGCCFLFASEARSAMRRAVSGASAGAGRRFSLSALKSTAARPADPERAPPPVLSRAWFEQLTTRHPKWRDDFAAVAAERQPKPMSSSDAAAEPEQFVISASDDMIAVDFECRYGVTCAMLHTVVAADHPVVDWMRRSGAKVIGKTNCATPFGLTEACALERYAPASAVQRGSCDVALVTSVIGGAALNAAAAEDVVGFKPSVDALPRNFRPPFSRTRSVGLIARDVPSMVRAWDVVVNGIRRVASEGATAAGADGNGNGVSGEPWDSAQLAAMAHKFSDAPLRIGVPTAWLDRLNDAEGVGSDFAALLAHRIAAAPGAGARAQPIEVCPIEFEFDADAVLGAATTVAYYELAEALLRKQLVGTGVLDQLPAHTVSCVFAGKQVSDAAYDAALAVVAGLQEDFAEEMGSVDCAALPLLSAPARDGNLRSIAGTLPFSMLGCPAVSLRLDAAKGGTTFMTPRLQALMTPGCDGRQLPVQLIGEAGQDTDLVDTAASLFLALR
jgi:Asp-tRNA(Asn)/Glu-tRNA(Gln) amidotransferase A subunit family amidase